MSTITVSVILAVVALFLIVGVVIAIATQLHTMIKCMVKMAKNQKDHSRKIEKIAEQRRQDYLDIDLRVSHIEKRLNRLGSNKRKGKNRW